MNKDNFQQGDTIYMPVESIPSAAKEYQRGERGFVVAHGESGHTHVIDCPVQLIEFYEHEGLLFFKNTQAVTVTHEEHKPLTIPPGTWKVDKVREYDYLSQMSRPVVD